MILGDTLAASADQQRDALAQTRSSVAAARAVIEAALHKLSPRQQEAIRHRFFGGLTLEVMGSRISVSRERMRQLETQAFYQLARALVRD